MLTVIIIVLLVLFLFGPYGVRRRGRPRHPGSPPSGSGASTRRALAVAVRVAPCLHHAWRPSRRPSTLGSSTHTSPHER